MSKKVGVIGVGHVGAHVAYALLVQGIASKIVLVDTNSRKLASEVNDLRDACAYIPHHVEVYSGGYEDLKDCDVIVHAAGKIDLLIGNHERTKEMSYTILMALSNAEKLKEVGFSGILINITNPCDVVTYTLQSVLKLEKGRVFGTGTGLDTARLLAALHRQTKVDVHSIDAYMIGEHGNQQFAPFSCMSFHGVPLKNMHGSQFVFDKEKLQQEAIGGGWTTFVGKNCTEYGIATTAARMVNAVLSDERCILPASALLDGEYGEKDVYAGVPCIIGENGVESVLELPLDTFEKEKFHACCEGIRENIAISKNM